MPTTITLPFNSNQNPFTTGLQVGDTLYYIDNANLSTSGTGGFASSNNLDNVIEIGVVTGFVEPVTSTATPAAASFSIVFSSESFSSDFAFEIIGNQNITYSNSSSYPTADTFAARFYYNNSEYTHLQTVSAGVIVPLGGNNFALNPPLTTAIGASSTAAGRASNFKAAIDQAMSESMTTSLSTTTVANDTLTITCNTAGASSNFSTIIDFGNSSGSGLSSITSSPTFVLDNSFTGGQDGATTTTNWEIQVEATSNINLPQTGDFIFYSKNNCIASSSLTGYFAEAKFVNTSTDYAEMFSAGVRAVESSK